MCKGCDEANGLTGSNELRDALVEFFDDTKGTWQYHDDFAYVPLYELDALRSALIDYKESE